MTPDPEPDSGSIPATDAWLEVLGIHVLRGRAPGTGGTAQGGSTPIATGTPKATDTVIFFDYNSAKLTDSAKQSLDAYAKAYLDAKSSEPIVVDGYASTEGTEVGNQKLAQDRADAVADYLMKRGKTPMAMSPTSGVADYLQKQGVTVELSKPGETIDNVSAKGQGATNDYSKDNLAKNRRAMISPPPPKPSSGTMTMRKKKEPTLGEKAEEPDISHIKISEPPAMVSRDVVEKALKIWLRALGKSQKLKTKDTVVTSKRVHVAEQTLLGNRPGKRPGEKIDRPATTPREGDGKGNDAGTLAHSIAQNLSEEIPEANFDNFLDMRPVEAEEEKKPLDQARAKLDKKADEILSDFGVPEKYREKIKDFVRDKTPDLIDVLPVDDTAKDIMKKAYEKINKSGGDE